MTSPAANIEAIYPLSPAQTGILFHSLYSPESPLYIQQYVCTLAGDLDMEVWRGSWDEVIARHQPLRSLMTWEGRDQPLQIVRRQVTPEWQVLDWRDIPSEEQEERLRALLSKDRSRGFDFETAPLFRLTLIRIDDLTHYFIWTHHHIIIDGWSIGLVLDEVVRLYDSELSGVASPLDEAPSYRQYVRWLKEHGDDVAEEHWRKELAGVRTATPLRVGDPAQSPWAEDHGSETMRLSSTVTAQLADTARRRGLTLNTMLRGAWAFLLSKYSGENDVVFGTTFAGRPPELAGSLDMVGLFINTLPVRISVPSTANVGDWLGGIQHHQIANSPFELTALSSVQGWSEIPSGEPLFESLLVVENVPSPGLGSDRLAISDPHYLQRSNYPLVVLAMPGEELELIFLFDRARFDASVVARMAAQLVTVLESMAAGLDRPLRELSLFPSDELQEILAGWNDTTAPYPEDRPIHELIAAMAAQAPNRDAVVGSGVAVAYAELEDRATAIAHRLVGSGVQRGDRVGVNLPRCPGAIVAILGVLKAGAAYVPLDPDLPPSRVAHLLGDTAAKAVIVGSGLADAASGHSPEIIAIDDAGILSDDPTPTAHALPDTNGDDLAYVLYTSGSTGEPKGVAVAHRSLVNSTTARLTAYGDPVERFLLLSPLIFDSSIAGVFSTLTQGGTLVLPAPRMEQDVAHLATLVDRHQITHTLALPTVYQLLLELADIEMLRSLRLVMVAGEACPSGLTAAHYAALPDTALANEYGPTEATVWCTVESVEPPHPGRPQSARVPIGRPIANTQIYILDDAGQPVPVGVPGELCVGGVGLAVGYHGKADQTSTSFVMRDLPGVGRLRLYRTGDVARFLPDGRIDLLGRFDQQVKIRGQRIELGEVEAVLRDHPSVHDVAVVVRQSQAGPALAAYVEANTDEDELRTFMAGHLPRAMVPATIDLLDSLPRGATGKVDRGALPDPSPRGPVADAVAPTGPVEEALAAIWRDVLGVDAVGATDDFFALGGDSILSIRVIARSHREGLRITPKQFFAEPTIAGLAAAARSHSSD